MESSEKQTSIVTPAPPGLASMMEAQDTVAAKQREHWRNKEKQAKEFMMQKERNEKRERGEIEHRAPQGN